jgi:hypothetical protein
LAWLVGGAATLATDDAHWSSTMFGQILDLADKLDIIQTVKAKLLRQPDPAADKLVAVLGELSKIYGACEAELRRYLSLSFDPAARLKEERDVLLTLESGQLRLRASEARGHCHKIWNIYQRYLERWFHAVLAPEPRRARCGTCLSDSATPTPRWKWRSRS